MDAAAKNAQAPTPRETTNDAKGYPSLNARARSVWDSPLFSAGFLPSELVTTSNAAENTVAMKCASTHAAVAAGIARENLSSPKTSPGMDATAQRHSATPATAHDLPFP